MILPEQNRKDWEEAPPEVRNKIKVSKKYKSNRKVLKKLNQRKKDRKAKKAKNHRKIVQNQRNKFLQIRKPKSKNPKINIKNKTV